ncbi:hypothetical protein BD560DRAFT_288792, partial [Blakeslea trispora]
LTRQKKLPSKKRHACTWLGCMKSFTRPSDMARHYRIHTNDRQAVKTKLTIHRYTYSLSALTVHQRTHSGEKPHICKYPSCNKSFADSSALARHRRIHTQPRLFVCVEPNCSKR